MRTLSCPSQTLRGTRPSARLRRCLQASAEGLPSSNARSGPHDSRRYSHRGAAPHEATRAAALWGRCFRRRVVGAEAQRLAVFVAARSGAPRRADQVGAHLGSTVLNCEQAPSGSAPTRRSSIRLFIRLAAAQDHSASLPSWGREGVEVKMRWSKLRCRTKRQSPLEMV